MRASSTAGFRSSCANVRRTTSFVPQPMNKSAMSESHRRLEGRRSVRSDFKSLWRQAKAQRHSSRAEALASVGPEEYFRAGELLPRTHLDTEDGLTGGVRTICDPKLCRCSRPKLFVARFSQE